MVRLAPLGSSGKLDRERIAATSAAVNSASLKPTYRCDWSMAGSTSPSAALPAAANSSEQTLAAARTEANPPSAAAATIVLGELRRRVTARDRPGGPKARRRPC